MSVWIERKVTAGGKVSYYVKHQAGRGGKRVHIGTGDTLKRAQTIQKRAQDSIAKHGQLVSSDVTPARSATLADVAADFAAASQRQVDAGRLAPTTHRSRMLVVNYHLGALARRPIATITPDDIQAWVNDLETNPRTTPGTRGGVLLAPGTVHIYWTVLRLIFDHARVRPNPVSRAQGVKKAPRGGRLSPDLPTTRELIAVRAALAEANDGGERVAMFDVIWHGGLRAAEARDLRWRQVQADGIVNLIGKGRGGRDSGGGTRRQVPVLAGQPAWVPQRPDGAADDDLVFPTVTRSTFASALTAACRKVGARPFGPHRLRHWQTSWMMGRLGQPGALTVPAMAKRNGHSQEMLLKTYSHELTSTDLADYATLAGTQPASGS